MNLFKHFPFCLSFDSMNEMNEMYLINCIYEKFRVTAFYKLRVEKTSTSISIHSFSDFDQVLFTIYDDNKIEFNEALLTTAFYFREYARYRQAKKQCFNTLIKTTRFDNMIMMYCFTFRNIYVRKQYADGYYYISQPRARYIPDALQVFSFVCAYHNMVACESVISHFSYTDQNETCLDSSNKNTEEYQTEFLRLIPKKYKTQYSEAISLSIYAYPHRKLDTFNYLQLIHEYSKLRQFSMHKILKSE